MNIKYLSINIFLVAVLLFTIKANAQQGFGTNNPAPSSVIDVYSGNKGALLPRIALTGTNDILTIPNPADALTIFNTATSGLAPSNVTPGYYYFSVLKSSWIKLIDNQSNFYNGLISNASNNVGLGGAMDHNSIIYYKNKSLTFWDGDEGSSFLASHSTVLDKSGIKLRLNDGGGGIDLSVKDYYLSIENTRTVNNTNTQLGTPFDGMTTGIKSIFSIGNANNEQYIGGQFGSNIDNPTGANPVQIGIIGKVGFNTNEVKNSQTIGGYFQSNNQSTASINNYALYAKATGINAYALFADGGSVLIKDLDNSAIPIVTGTRPVSVDVNGKLVIGNSSLSAWNLSGNTNTTAGTNFIGTTNAQDLVFKTNSIENLRINQNGRLITSSTFPAVGSNSLYIGNAGNDTQLSGAVKNTAVGYQSMNTLTDGSENTAFGQQTLNSIKDGIGNTAIGVQALNKSVSTLENTAIGYKALNNTTGDGNTAIGGDAGANLTSGSNNTAVGMGTNFASATANYQLNIANNIFGTGLNGSSTAPKGKIGIGTTAPDNALHVKAAADPLKLEGLQNGSVGDKMLTIDATGVVKQQIYPGLLNSNFVSTSYLVQATDYIIVVTQPIVGATINITLPNAALNSGRVINISNFCSSAIALVNIKSFNGSALQLKTGTTSAVSSALLEPADGTVASGKGKSTWISNGALWYIIGN